MAFQNLEVVHVVAMDQQRCIGKANDLPWHISADLKHFKAITQGSMFDITKIIGKTDMAYLARVAVNTPANTEKAKKAIKKALTKQMNGEGFCLVEILSMCPTNWKMSEVDACEYIKTTQSKYLPLGEFVDKGGNE